MYRILCEGSAHGQASAAHVVACTAAEQVRTGPYQHSESGPHEPEAVDRPIRVEQGRQREMASSEQAGKDGQCQGSAAQLHRYIPRRAATQRGTGR